MTKKVDTWMPLLVDKYLGDTTNLTTEQHGAYLLLLMAMWKKDGVLPDSDQQLASIAKLQPARWRAHKAVLMQFFQSDVGGLTQKRLIIELIRAKKMSNAKAGAGAKGAAMRWHGDGKPDGKPDGTAIAEPLANGSRNDAPARVFLPLPIPTPSELIPEADASSSPAEPPPCPHRRLLAVFAERVPELPQPRRELWEGGKGAEAMRGRWKWLMTASREDGERYATTSEEGIEWMSKFFERVAESDFLTGRDGKWRGCDLTWLMNRENFAKVIQGNYIRQSA